MSGQPWWAFRCCLTTCPTTCPAECVEDGYQWFAGGRCITVFSATNYCGAHSNDGVRTAHNSSIRTAT